MILTIPPEALGLIIADPPLQINSPGKHTPGWGCYVHDIGLMAMDQCGEVLNPAEFLKLIITGVREKEILDNDIPTTAPGWRRIYVQKSVEFIRRVALDLGHSLMECRQLGKFSVWESVPTTANYAIIEYETNGRDKEGNEYWGSHFVLAVIDVTTWDFIIVYNPWPKLGTLTGKTISYRKWEVRR